MPLVITGFGMCHGDGANNMYADPSPEARQRMQDEYAARLAVEPNPTADLEKGLSMRQSVYAPIKQWAEDTD